MSMGRPWPDMTGAKCFAEPDWRHHHCVAGCFHLAAGLAGRLAGFGTEGCQTRQGSLAEMGCQVEAAKVEGE